MIQQSRVIVTDKTALSLTTWGDASPSIVLIHGFADGRYIWTPFVPALAGYASVLAMDLRGHGDSAWDAAGVYSMDKFVEDAQHVIDQMCSGELVLIGHSLGAEIAIRLCVAYAGRVKGLVLVDGGPGLVSDGMVQMRSNFTTRPRDYASRQAYRQAMRDWMPLADEAMLDLAAQHAIAPIDEQFRLKSDPALTSMPLPIGDAGLWPILESLPCDSLLIRGEGSAVLSRRTTTDMAQRLPSLRCETVSVAGHAVMMDNPAEFGALLEGFVAGIYDDANPSSTANAMVELA